MNRYNKAIAYMMYTFIAALCLSGWAKAVQELTNTATEYGATGWEVARVFLVLNAPIFVACVLIGAILHGRKLVSSVKVFLRSIIGMIAASLILEGGLLLGLTKWSSTAETVMEVGIVTFVLLLIVGNFKRIKSKIRSIKQRDVLIRNVRL